MILKKMFPNCFLLGFLIMFPVSGFGVVSGPTIEPVVADIMKPGNYCIDIAAQSWQKDNNKSSLNTKLQIINDFGTINEINPTNTGNSSDFTFDTDYDDFNTVPDERLQISSVPEPATLLLLGLGTLGLAALKRRR